MTEIKLPNAISIKSPVKIENVIDKFVDVVTSVNELESMVKAEAVSPAIVGYHVGKIYSSLKEILRVLNITLPEY